MKITWMTLMVTAGLMLACGAFTRASAQQTIEGEAHRDTGKGGINVGPDFHRAGAGLLCRGVLVRALLRARLRRKAMNAEYIISGVIAALLLVYLLYALLEPEKF